MKKLVGIGLLILLAGCASAPTPKPPLPPPPPVKMTEVTEGHRVRVTFEHGPINVEGISEDSVYRREVIYEFNWHFELRRIGIFIATDRGDTTEQDVEIWDHDLNIPIYTTSPHKESMTRYDAWNWVYLPANHYEYFGPTQSPSKRIKIVFINRTNGTNSDKDHVRYGERTSRGHFGVHLVGRKYVVIAKPSGTKSE